MPRTLLKPVTAARRNFFPLPGQPSRFNFRRSRGREGVNLLDALTNKELDLEGKDDLMFDTFGPKMEYVVQFFATRCSRQKHAQKARGTVSRTKVVKQVAEVVLDIMRKEGWVIDNSSTALKSWYLMALIRIGVSTFACVLEYDPSIDAAHTTIGGSLTSTSHGSTESVNIAAHSGPSHTPSTASSFTSTNTVPIGGSLRAGSDANALAQTELTPPEGHWRRAKFTNLQLPHGIMATADTVAWPGTLSSSFIPSPSAAERDTVAGTTEQYNTQPIHSTATHDTSSTNPFPIEVTSQGILGAPATNYTSEPASFTDADSASLGACLSALPHVQMANKSSQVGVADPSLQSTALSTDFATTQSADPLWSFPQWRGSQGMEIDYMIGMPSSAVAKTSRDAYPMCAEIQSLGTLQNDPFAIAFEERDASSQFTEQEDQIESHIPSSLPASTEAPLDSMDQYLRDGRVDALFSAYTQNTDYIP